MKKTFAWVLLWILSGGGAYAESVRETPAVKVVREWGPSVVNISTERISLVKRNVRIFPQSQWNQQLPTVYGIKSQSLGSGVIVSADGVIATNAHVVEMASSIIVAFQNGKTYKARVLGTDKASDLALLAIETEGPLKPIELAEDALIGETVLTVGNPFGLQNSVSQGIISATGRSFTTNPPDRAFQDLIQTDAAIHPGASGGALINLEGKLTGINLALFEGASDISFAIPSYKIRNMLQAYDRVKSVVRPGTPAPGKKKT